MNREVSWRSAIGSSLIGGLSLLLVLPLAWAQEAEGDKDEKPAKASKVAKSKAAFGDDDEEEKGEKPDDGEEFGGSRKEKPKAAPKSSVKGTAKTKSTAEKKEASKEDVQDREKQKLVKQIEKRLGKKEDGYFVFQVMEQKVVETEAATEEQKSKVGNSRLPFVPVEEVEFHVVEGRQAAADFIADYISKYPPPDKKSSRSKRQKGDVLEIPAPQRGWDFIRAFPDTQEGNLAAHELRDQVMANYKQKQWGGNKK
ncbi:MAG: hypothetical protein U1D30_02880 [Planctomycetota bacterium]